MQSKIIANKGRKILIVHVISDTNIGGAGHYLLTYLRNFNRTVYDVKVVLPEKSKLLDGIVATGVEVVTVNGLADRSFSGKGVMSLMRVLMRLKPSIVHAHAALSARVAAKLCRIPAIFYTRHSVFEPDPRQTRGIRRRINALAGSYLADGIIAVANAARRNLTDTGINPNKITLIYNGVEQMHDLNVVQTGYFKKTMGFRDVPLISIMARLERIKGHEYLIKAAKILTDRGIDCDFAIAGTGTERDVLEASVKDSNLSDRIFFLGFVSDVNSLLSLTTIQVNTSYGTEAASLSLLEGMSLGVPAVVTNYGGNPEIIIDGVNGYVIPQKDEVALADKIEQLLQNQEQYAHLKEGAIRLYHERFTAKKMTEAMEKYYEEILLKKLKGKRK